MLVWTELFQTAGCFEIVVLQRSLQKNAIKNAFMQRWFKGFREPKLSVACALRAMQIKLGRTVARWTTSKVRELHATEAKARVWRWQHKSMNCALYNKKQRRCYDSQHTQCAYIDVHGELCETLPVHYFQANITKLCAIANSIAYHTDIRNATLHVATNHGRNHCGCILRPRFAKYVTTVQQAKIP